MSQARVLTPVLLVLATACRVSDEPDRVGELTLEVGDLQAEVEALQEQVDAMEAAQMAADIEALQARVDGHDADLDEVDARLTSLEEAGYATETWVEEQGYALQSDVDALSSRVDGIDLSVGVNTDTLSEVSLTLSSHTASIDDNSTNIASNTASISTNAAAISTNASDIADNASGISTNAADIADNAADIADNAADIADNVADIADNVADIADNADDIADNAADIADNVEALDHSFSGFTPALWEYSNSSLESSYDQGNHGFLLLTSGGAFWLSGYVTSSFSTNRVWFVTFYVTNPSSSDVDVTLEMCRGDSTSVYLDGTLAASPSDLDGSCGSLSPIAFSAGDHVLQIRYVDSNNWFEGLGITNAWIDDYGLEVDWDGLRAANASGI